MKIIKYEKRKNGMYQVFFDNGNDVDLHENIILNHNLLIKKQTTPSELEEMLDENKKFIAYNLAIKYISIKMRTKKEIVSYLLKKNIDKKEINEVVELLTKEKYLDDFTYAKAYVNDRILLSSDGPNKIRAKLEELEIDNQVINKALDDFDNDMEKEKIEKLSKKLVASNRNKSINALKNKMINYIYNLGYNKAIIMEVISNIKFSSDKDIAKKEYEKIYKRLSKKYSGSELEFRIKQKMYSLGFTNYNE